ncbi:MAG: GNAT family N-acetyltransferase [Pseudomonadota bacterium]
MTGTATPPIYKRTEAETRDRSETVPLVSNLLFNRIEWSCHDSISPLETDWKELESRAKCSPFQRLSWVKPLYQNIHPEVSSGGLIKEEPFLITGHLNNQMVIVLPMVIEASILGKCLKWIGSDISDYNGMIVDENIIAEIPRGFFDKLMAQVAEIVPDLDAIFLTRNPEIKNSLKSDIFPRGQSWDGEHSSHTLGLSHDWKSLYANIRSKKSRQRLRSKFRALQNKYEVTFRQVRNPEEKAEATNQILEWKSSQLKNRGSRNPFGSEVLPSRTRMTINASVDDNCKKSVKVFGIYLDNQLVAGMLAFIADGKFYYLVSAYAPAFPSQYSVGTHLLVKTLELASRAGLQEYDFLLGDEAYKFDWCDTHVPLKNYLIPLTVKGSIYGLGIKSALTIKKQIMDSNFTNKVLRQMIKATSINHHQLPVGRQAFSPPLSDRATSSQGA